jgi:hypothetical protein
LDNTGNAIAAINDSFIRGKNGKSMAGSRRHTLNKGANQLPFNITNLAAGSYTAVVSSNNEVYSKKLVVVK